jgi:hypothetical protein
MQTNKSSCPRYGSPKKILWSPSILSVTGFAGAQGLAK